jgi:hypothetical protein
MRLILTLPRNGRSMPLNEVKSAKTVPAFLNFRRKSASNQSTNKLAENVPFLCQKGRIVKIIPDPDSRSDPSKKVRIYADRKQKYGLNRREREVLFCAYKILRREAG